MTKKERNIIADCIYDLEVAFLYKRKTRKQEAIFEQCRKALHKLVRDKDNKFLIKNKQGLNGLMNYLRR